MAGATSNIHEVEEFLSGVVTSLDPTDARNSERLAKPIRKGIAERAAARGGPDGRWAANIGRYAVAKAKAGRDVGDGLSDGTPRMLDPDQLAGEIVDATAKGFDLAFGVDEDVKHRGQWFQNGSSSPDDGTDKSGSKTQAARPFWGLTDQDANGVVDEARAIINEAIG